MGKSTTSRIPNLGKTTVAILEYYAEKVIGESAKDEIKKPYEEQQKREKLAGIFADTEDRFIKEYDDKEVSNILLNLSLKGLPTLVEAVNEFYDRPASPILDSLLQERLIEDLKIDGARAEHAAKTFMDILREELATSDFAEIREKLSAWANLRTERGIRDLVEMEKRKVQPEPDYARLRSEYFQYLVNDLKEHTLRGYAPQVGGRVLSLPLSKIFLPLEAVEGRPALAEYAEQDLRRMAAEGVNQQPMRELDWQERLQEKDRRFVQLKAKQAAQRPLNLSSLLQESRAVLLGDPGSGKTTITRYITYSIAAGDETHTGDSVRERIPILIRIANYAKALEKDTTLHLIDYVERELIPRQDFGRFLRYSIENGECLIILDGLDEVSNRGLRVQVTDQIQKLVAVYESNQFLVTSRIVGYDLSPMTREFTHATLKELTSDEQIHFIRLWYDAIHSEISEMEQAGSEKDLIDALENKPQIARMAANPLLLTIMVLMHWRGFKLPSRRVQVYQNATDTLVEYWTAQRGVADLDSEEVKAILTPIAHHILSSNVGGVIAHNVLLPKFYKGIANQRGCSSNQARQIGKQMLQEINEQSGIFLERGVDENGYPVYGFLHQTFGEYLAALHLADQMLSSTFNLGEYIHRSSWYESLLLMAGHLSINSKFHANKLIREILDFPAPYEDVLKRNVLLAADCLADDIQLQPDLRNEILTKLAVLLKHPSFPVSSAAVECFNKLASTRHREPAVAAICNSYSIQENPTLSEIDDQTRKNVAIVLMELEEKDLAKPIILSLRETRHGGYLMVDTIYFMGWPEEGIEYLQKLQKNKSSQFSISVGEDFASCHIAFINLDSAAKILNVPRLVEFTESLASQEHVRSIKANLSWIIALIQDQSNSYLALLSSENPSRVRRLAATKLLNTAHHAIAVTHLRELAQCDPDEAPLAIQALIKSGETTMVDLGLLREMTLIPEQEIALDAIETLFLVSDMICAVSAAISYLANFPSGLRILEIIQSLLLHGYREIALAAATILALQPDSRYRYQACEFILDAGELDAAIPLLEILAYESYRQAGQAACRRLLVLHETERIASLLRYLAEKAAPEQKYQACLALALAGISLKDKDLLKGDRCTLLPSVISQRDHLYQSAILKFVTTCRKMLESMTIKEPLERISQTIALISLEQLEGKKASEEQAALLNDIPLPIAHLHVGLINFRSGQVDSAHRTFMGLLKNEASSTKTPARYTAIQELGKIIHPSTADAILPYLRDEDSDVRWSAADALGSLGDPRAVEALLQALRDEESDVSWSAADALGSLGDPRAVEALLQALGDEESYVRGSAAAALGELGDPRAVEALLQALRDEDSDVRRSAAAALGELGDPRAVEALLQALRDEESYVRWSAAAALGSLGDPRAVEALLLALRDEDSDVSRIAAAALGKLGDPRAVEALLQALRDEESDVRGRAAAALGSLGDPRAVEALLQALWDEESYVCGSAAAALGELGDPRAVEALLQALRDEDSDVSRIAAAALGKLGDPRAVEALLQALRDEESDVRWSAADALGSLGDPRAVEALLQALRDEESYVRGSAAAALGSLGDPRAVEALLQALRDEESYVRGSAAAALGSLGDPRAVEALLQALRDEESNVRGRAAAALGSLGDPRAVEALLQALRDEDSDVRGSAAAALGNLGDNRAVLILAATCATQDHAMALLRLDLDTALSLFEQHCQWFPYRGWMFRMYSQALWEKGKQEEAITNLLRSVEIHRDHRNFLSLAHFYLEISNLPLAEKYAHLALKKANQYQRDLCWLTQAVVLWKQDDKEAARNLLEKVRRTNKRLIDLEDLRKSEFWRQTALSCLEEMLADKLTLMDQSG